MKKIIYIFLVAILSSCASKYNLLQPELANYNTNTSINDGIEISYEHNSLNKNYGKKANQKDIRIVSVKIKNNRKEAIQQGKDFKLVSSSDNNLLIIPPHEVFVSIKQRPASHLLYLLLTPLKLFRNQVNEYGVPESEEIFPIGYILGPAISIGNMVAASNANKKLNEELKLYDIQNTVINPGQTVYGLVGIRSFGFPNITSQSLY